MFFKKKKEVKKFVPNQMSKVLNVLPFIPIVLLALMMLFGGVKSEGDAIVDTTELVQQKVSLKAPKGFIAMPGKPGYYQSINGESVIGYFSGTEGAANIALRSPDGFTRAGVETRMMFGQKIYMAVFTEDNGDRIAIAVAYDKLGETRYVLGLGRYEVLQAAGYLLGYTINQ